MSTLCTLLIGFGVVLVAWGVGNHGTSNLEVISLTLGCLMMGVGLGQLHHRIEKLESKC